MQIGEVAERTGLSLRTIRYYEEVGLVRPSARSQGGFRLYTDPDVARLLLIKRMKPLGFQLEEMRELLAVLRPDDTGAAGAGGLGAEEAERLRGFSEAAERRCAELRAKLEDAEAFAGMLRRRLDERTSGAVRSG
nr:MerR family transcriptional regulator [Amycolatopsis aidingensis]